METQNQVKGQMRVFVDVLAERKQQDAKHGGPAHDDAHALHEFAWFIEHQGDRMRAPGRQDDPQHMRARFVKVAALAFAAIESIDRKASASATSRPPKYCFGISDESFDGEEFDTIEDALAAGIAARLDGAATGERIDTVFVGQICDVSDVFDDRAPGIVDDITCDLSDQVGEVAELFDPDVAKVDELSELIGAWFRVREPLTCFRVDHIVEYHYGNPLFDATLSDALAAESGTEQAA